jgi:surface polysaccharide O-acyltransferase-like enzyme
MKLEETGTVQPRFGNIELLRIVSMLLIVCNHFEGHALAIQGFEWGSANLYSNWLIRGIGYIGVNLYVLISAYFLCMSSFKAKKLLKLLVEVWFYSMIIYGLFVGTGQVSFSFKGFFKSFLPTLCSQYWFVTCYVVMYILSPFFNKLILLLYNKRALMRFSFLLFVLFCVIPNFFFFSEWIHFGGTCGIVWMSVVYFFGATIRYQTNIEKLKERKRLLFGGMIICWILPLITKVVIAFITQKVMGSVIGSSLFYMNNSIVIVVSSIITFLAFLSIEIKGTVINFVAPSTLAVYLIHDNVYVRPLLWKYSLELLGEVQYPSVLYVLLLTLGIFSICVLIDLFRRLLFYAIDTVFEIRLLQKLYNKVDSYFSI